VSENIVVLVITLVTWVGVFLYLLRVDAATKKLEQEIKVLEEDVHPRSVPPISQP
jgi:CcmD family protein